MNTYGMLGAALCVAVGVAGCSGEDPTPPVAITPAAVTFDVTDEAGHWFDLGEANKVGGTRSLAIVKPGDKVAFLQTKSIHGPGGANGPSRVESFHTVTSLIWPADATAAERIDQDKANRDDHEVTLNAKGLYVFVCKLHPYMLAGVIVDDPATTKPNSSVPAFDIGDKLHLLGVTHTTGVKEAADAGAAFTSNSDLGLRLLRAFFIVTSPSNWKDYTKVGQAYRPSYPPVAVKVNPVGALPLPDGIVPDLNAALQSFFDGDTIPAATAGIPAKDGVGEVWVDTQYEVSTKKGEAYPSTVTVVDVEGTKKWTVTRKLALPNQKMNNAHNLWASEDQKHIYNTEWHGKSLYVHNREDGKLLQEIELGNDPAHVMTRVGNATRREQVHVGMNGEDVVVELNKDTNGTLSINRRIPVQHPGEHQAQPHAHWMGHDGETMVTPNSNTNDSTFWDFITDKIKAKPKTGALPIAAGINPDSTTYYVSNYLGHSTSVIRMSDGVNINTINLLQHYDPLTGAKKDANGKPLPIGGLPIQTPVSPDGKFVVTGNTLTGTITIIDTAADGGKGALVASVECDPGCHGVNFGAKKGGGYYAYVTSKFSNRLIVLDYDADNDGVVTHTGPDAPVIAGWVVLADATAPLDDPADSISKNQGMGGQGLLPVPNVYNGWVQKLPKGWCDQLSDAQRNPVGAPLSACPES
ncbi:Cupredoxin containing protein with WD40/YVTN repeat-like-containing domain [Candidatus Nitrospira nitrosa]|uniref:Cupredoxin containing protein with WD40/YVTN repeat-like-containing domain n=1 Tax=Candidatus Nitrospira nitrosa TaxID=1742972 RepID=A0A0S4L7K8_9BACT|nr:beta-propeller fold lactonase family protein [Candidatus Nitrospira nitrosa]CUS33697.1 Cupredoxin containing protein with WD40/YVTN repeat-like-containing domain [Candidatus Nitrospira nitrosa]